MGLEEHMESHNTHRHRQTDKERRAEQQIERSGGVSGGKRQTVSERREEKELTTIPQDNDLDVVVIGTSLQVVMVLHSRGGGW